MKDFFNKYRLLIVTILISGAAVVRVAYPEFAVPSDEELTAWLDKVAAVIAPIAWLVTYFYTDTSKGSLAENTDTDTNA